MKRRSFLACLFGSAVAPLAALMPKREKPTTICQCEYSFIQDESDTKYLGCKVNRKWFIQKNGIYREVPGTVKSFVVLENGEMKPIATTAT